MDKQPTPARKRYSLMNGGRKRPLECERESQEQFSNTMKQISKSINIDEPVASNLMCSNNVRVSSNVKNSIPYNLQKLRILSPDGRDLGEFKVELKSTNSSKGNAITIGLSKSKSIDKPLTFPLSPVSHTRTFPQVLKDIRKIPKISVIEAMSCNKGISSTDNNNALCQQQSTILNDPGTEDKMEKQTCNSKMPSTDERNSVRNKSRHSVCQTVIRGNQKYVICHETGDIHNCTKVQEIAKNNEVSSVTKTPLHKEIVKSPRSVNSNIEINAPLSGKSLKISRGKCIATIRNTENGKIVMSLKSAANLVHNQIDKNLNHDDSHNDSRKNFNSDKVSYDKNNLLQIKSDIVPKNQVSETQNVMTIIPNDKTLSLNQNAVLVQENDTSVASGGVKNMASITDHSTVRHDLKCNNMQSKGSKAESRDDHLIVTDDYMRIISQNHKLDDYIPKSQIREYIANVESKVQSKNLPPKNLSNRLHVIKRALDSVKDNELRELALKALADCGIGIERYVPIRPPEDHKIVHDTQVQTTVFGLLDPKSFLLINKDLEDIHRINQITLHDMPDDENLMENLHSNSNFLFKNPNVIERESPFDLDSFMEQFWNENSDSLKIKETLSMTKVRCNKLLKHLQRDFDCVKEYDQDGMLNIHNAVISDNIHLVRRQLMVLKYCKQSVDILTEDGVTSLELAVKYDICSEIVKLLLDAGAQPVTSSIRESAVIIASKQSSPLLSMLVRHVSDSKLLDQIDLDGLAAIHYCSIHGNLEGVKALISAGATVDLKDMRSGRTSLFHAIDNGHTSVMKVLLKAGAVANIANYAGQTALSIITDPKSMAFKMSLKKGMT